MVNDKREKPVLYHDDGVAEQVTLTGWRSRHGHFYGDNEHLARWDGCTHVICACGTATPKHYTACEACRQKADDARYLALPLADWNGEMVCTFDNDRFFRDEEEFLDWCELEELDPAEVQLVACEPRGLREVDPDYWTDELPEDGELPGPLQDALDAFNAVVREHNKTPSVWWAIDQRVSFPSQERRPGDEHLAIEDGQWYFYDETEDRHGPFDDKDAARAALLAYSKQM